MPRNFSRADEDCVYDKAALLKYYSSDATNDENKRQMRMILVRAVDRELTEREKYCVKEYFFNRKKMKDIASSISVNPSTVTRYIQRAIKKLRHIAEYY